MVRLPARHDRAADVAVMWVLHPDDEHAASDE
jgi:hypothetical protein